MKYIKFSLIGILFGIVMTKSEAISWFRIQEMFLFDSFHMYGIIGTAVVLGTIGVQIIKRFKLKTFNGAVINFKDKPNGIPKLLIGGSIFGMGWAMTGACPGPLYVLIGHGILPILVVITSAIFGTLVYGMIRHKLPH